jgi:hypothetical protein
MFLFLKVVITFFECVNFESNNWVWNPIHEWVRLCQIVKYKQVQVVVISIHKELTLLRGKQRDDQVVWQGKTSKVWQEVDKGDQYRWGCKVRAKFVATNDHLFNECPTSSGMGLKWTDSNSERRILEYLERWGT